MAVAGRRPGHRDAQPRLLGCETVQEAMVGRLPYPAPLDVVRRRHSAASARAKRPYRPVLRLSNRAWIVDELVSSRRQIQFTPAKPELGELVRAAQGLANAGRLYRLGYCPKGAGSTHVGDSHGGSEARWVRLRLLSQSRCLQCYGGTIFHLDRFMLCLRRVTFQQR